MTVARILGDKGREVITTEAHHSLLEVIKLLAGKGIGAVVVSDPSRAVLGIISERDIVRAIGANGSAALGEPVSRHMTARVSTVTEDTLIHSVMETMTNGRFRHMPVVSGAKLIGLISIGDVVKHHVSEIETEKRALAEYIASA